MDIKEKTNNELLGLMNSHEEETDTYKLAYQEFTERYISNISQYNINVIMGISTLAKDIKEGADIDEEYWNDECHMNIDTDRVDWYENHFQQKDRSNSIATR